MTQFTPPDIGKRYVLLLGFRAVIYSTENSECLDSNLRKVQRIRKQFGVIASYISIRISTGPQTRHEGLHQMP